MMKLILDPQNPFTKYVLEVRKSINRLRKEERFMIKKYQSCCPHHNMMLISPRFSLMHDLYTPIKHKTICADCGKVLSR